MKNECCLSAIASGKSSVNTGMTVLHQWIMCTAWSTFHSFKISWLIRVASVVVVLIHHAIPIVTVRYLGPVVITWKLDIGLGTAPVSI